MKLSDVRDLLDTALDILGDSAGRVELADGRRRVRIGRVSASGAPSADAVSGPEGMRAPPEGITIRAPAIGVISLRDNRTDRPLVELGQTVTQGQTLAFISSMEITTKVTAPAAGVVEEVLVDDGDGVEFNAPLLKIIPSV
ncbi:MAG: hypothetical protein A3G34_01410 [Candidatus Lindowbacteria bacterium RIFCSPLOWO2_12_FULL_62_27]|nr:MAG: hypothetical protein A3G34_01410 [Candidatus Lindowbacteria bacterium RIFCSPLOWO2_12_FULL_62_27]